MPIDKDKLGALATGKTSYDQWLEDQDIPVITGFYIEDLNEVNLKPWAWKGGKGAFLNLEGTDETNDAYICEINPGGKLNPMKHLYEEFVYVFQGRGGTRIWQDGQTPRTFEWQAGSIFSIPVNVNYQHFNGSGSEAVRYVSVTSAPLIINLYHNMEFVFNCPFSFLDRFNGEEDFFSGEGRELKGRTLDTNFIADVNKVKLLEWNERGKGSTNRMLELANSTMGAHISEFEVGKYKKAHRHGPGAHVFIIGGEGYTLMWREGEDFQKFDWKPGSLIVPPEMWFHQHFNSGATPAKYMAFRRNGRKYRVFKQYKIDADAKKGGDQIEYRDEDPRIREIFGTELAKRGVKSQMDDMYL
jgi:mannose-6-phosphate isomerase-like protein (cupin superfamily)